MENKQRFRGEMFEAPYTGRLPCPVESMPMTTELIVFEFGNELSHLCV